jgi:hypothetical protein
MTLRWWTGLALAVALGGMAPANGPVVATSQA